jgi:lipoate-protein ligase A
VVPSGGQTGGNDLTANSIIQVRSTGESWYLLHSGACAPDYNMALDEALLEAAPIWDRPVLRFFGWQPPAASFGYFQKFAEAAFATSLRPLIRRPTGGGLVLHDADWTYSVTFPPSHPWYALRARQSYARVHQWIRAAFTQLDIATEMAPSCRNELPSQCFTGYEKNDVLHAGRKIAGAAQRRTKTGLLIQGSIQPPLGPTRENWEKAIVAIAEKEWGVVWQKFPPNTALAERAQTLRREKYAQTGYNRMR